MAFVSLLSAILGAANGDGSSFVLLFVALGGFSGFAALAMVFVNHKANKNKAVVDVKSVAITELEKGIPGMGDIFTYWQDVVHSQQDQINGLKEDLRKCTDELQKCADRVKELESGGK